jgi:hypothetical protein
MRNLGAVHYPGGPPYVVSIEIKGGNRCLLDALPFEFQTDAMAKTDQ